MIWQNVRKSYAQGSAVSGCLPQSSPQYEKDVKVFEGIQQRATKLVRVLEAMLCEERLRALGLSSWERRRLRGDPAALCYVLRWGSAEGSAGLCSLITTGRIPGKGTKLCQGRFRLGSRKYFFTVRGWSNTGTGFLVRWPMPHAWQRSRGNWKMPSLIHFNFWLA